MNDPPLSLGTLAEGQGAVGFGPCATLQETAQAIHDAVQAVRSGKIAVVDVSVAPEYARATSNAMLHQSKTGS